MDISFLCPLVCLTSIVVFIRACAAAGSTLEFRLFLVAPMFRWSPLESFCPLGFFFLSDVPNIFVRSLAKITIFGLVPLFFSVVTL